MIDEFIKLCTEKGMFLMHRVELKVVGRMANIDFEEVPNAPCGVERCLSPQCIHAPSKVPNAPCGVESRCGRSGSIPRTLFLMHRVELKAS